MRNRISALCLLLALLPTATQAAVISRSTEISMGREGAEEYERQAAVDVDPVLTARVRRIGSRLIAAGEAPPYPFEFHSVETNQINAFALPGGFIYIFRGLTQLVPGDDALAFIMAHEISHVTQRHGINQLEKSLAISTLLNFALRGGTTSGVLQLVIGMHYSRHDEAEADRIGLALMTKAGFDPTQGAEAMAMLARAAKSERSMPALLRSHPLPESRIAALKKEAAALLAAPRPKREIPDAPPLPIPDRLPPPPAAIASSDLFPLAVGMSWSYRVAGSDKQPSLTTTVLEQLPGEPGVFRVQLKLDEGIASTRLLTVTSGSVCARPGSPRLLPGPRLSGDSRRQGAAPWQTEIRLPDREPGPGHEPITWETVRVPAGEYRAVRVEQRSPRDELASVWLAPGVGVVRREWKQSGLVEELELLHRPTPDESHNAPTGSEAARGPMP